MDLPEAAQTAMEVAHTPRTAPRALAIQTVRAEGCAPNLDLAFFALPYVRRETGAHPIGRARRKRLRQVIKLPFVSQRTTRAVRPMGITAAGPLRAPHRAAVGAGAIRTSVVP